MLTKQGKVVSVGTKLILATGVLILVTGVLIEVPREVAKIEMT
jgi:hypothetical protein